MHWERVLPRHALSQFILISLLEVCLLSVDCTYRAAEPPSLWIFLGFASATCLRDMCVAFLFRNPQIYSKTQPWCWYL